MQATILHGAGDVRVEERDMPTITEPTDAVVKLVAACVCGSDLRPYRGADRTSSTRTCTRTAGRHRSASTSRT